MQQLLNDVLNVLAHITCFGQGGGVGHHKRHVQHTRHGLREQGFARARGANQQDVAFGQLDVVFLRRLFVLQALVVVVNRHSQGALGQFLTNHIVIEIGFDFSGCGQVVAVFFVFGSLQTGQLITDDFVAQVNALIANEDRGACNEFLDFVLALTAESAVERFFARSAFFINHEVLASGVSFSRVC